MSYRRHYVMPFAFGVDETGMPDAEAKARLDKALEVATRIKKLGHPIMIFLGAGMPERTQKYGIPSLAASAKLYLVSKGWPENQIAMNPKGYSTMIETMAFREYLEGVDGDIGLHFVTSWLHIARVYAVCQTIFWGRNSVRMEFYPAVTPFKGRTLVHFLLREAIALPRSVYMAWRARN